MPHCSTLQQAATRCNTLQHTATHQIIGEALEIRKHHDHTATHGNTLQHITTRCNTHTATRCNNLQHTTTHCNTLQHAATHQIIGEALQIRKHNNDNEIERDPENVVNSRADLGKKKEI